MKRQRSFQKRLKTKGKSTFRGGIQAPRATPGMCGGGPFQGTTRPEGRGPLLPAQVLVRRSAPSTRTKLEERNGRKTLETQMGKSLRPWSVAGTMAPSGNGEQCATLAVHRHARSTSELPGTALRNAKLSLLENAQEAVRKQCTLPEPQ